MGHAKPQAISNRGAGIDPRVGHSGFVAENSIGARSLRVFWFPLPILIRTTSQYSLIT
jgi:hypothetical protein